MKDVGIHVLLSIGIAFLFYEFQELMMSTYIVTFLKQNLITLILALLAINTTTLGIVLTKIRELIDKENVDCFKKTKKQMMLSITEQIVIVFIALVVFTVSDSTWLKTYSQFQILVDVSCISLFIYDLLILFDTSKSIFIILDFKS